jgi:hypothetical protein
MVLEFIGIVLSVLLTAIIFLIINLKGIKQHKAECNGTFNVLNSRVDSLDKRISSKADKGIMEMILERLRNIENILERK